MVMLLSPLDRKLLRDLERLWAQALAIALVIASGVALLIMALTTIEALEETTGAYYERYGFADVFAEVTRAPEGLSKEAAALEGVKAVETRIVRLATLDLPNFEEPATARVVSLPERGEARLNRLVLRAGRLPQSGRDEEAVLLETFAQAHGLRPGDNLSVILNGVRRELRVVGLALSPEFVYVIAPGGLMPDDLRFGVIWMGRDALAAAYDMKEAFNELSLTLLRGADPQSVIAPLDRLLSPYGGAGAYGREDQVSNWFLQNEIDQQKNMAGILPAIFLAVAAFLTQMVMSRIIATERSEIGLLKAFGYSDLAVGWHYAKMVLAIGLAGVAIGFVAGSWLGHFNTRLYAEFYHFPFLLYRPGAESYAIAAMVSLSAALGGSLLAVSKAATLPPAEAMRPPAPPVFRRTRVSGTAAARFLDEPSRMIARRIIRWPLRALASATGIALSLAVLFLALQWTDAIDKIIEENFFHAQRQDATLALVEKQEARSINDLAALPGVLSLETALSVSGRISKGPVSRRQAIMGLSSAAQLSPIYDVKRGVIAPPPEGILLSTMLAGILGVKPGEQVYLEVLEGRRPAALMTVAGVFESYIDAPIYMEARALSRFLGESPQVNLAQLRIDGTEKAAFFAAVKETPMISAVSFRSATIASFRATVGETIYIFVTFFAVFSCTLAFGVVYNSVRIALSERARELATLRVLGFTRLEIAYVLLGEIGIITVLSLPLGVAAGIGLAWYISKKFATELFRVPLVINDATLGISAAAIIATALVCALLVRRRLDRLDLIAVLKTRE
jgi:putative ABC transport system permease protein